MISALLFFFSHILACAFAQRPDASQIEKQNFRSFRSTDMLQDIFRTLGFRLSLDSIAKASLGATKTANGLKSVEWYKNGELDKVAEYCKADVDITRRVYEFGRNNGFVHYYSKLGSKLKVAVNWK